MIISIMGCGALGSRIAFDLACPDLVLHLYDFDRVKAENVGTSLYTRLQIGKTKASALAGLCSVKGQANYFHQDITRKKIEKCDLIVDCLDNASARNSASMAASLRDVNICHVGVAPGVGEISWGETVYEHRPGDNEVCTHQLGLPVIALTAAVGVVSILEYLATGNQSVFLVNASGKVMKV